MCFFYLLTLTLFTYEWLLIIPERCAKIIVVLCLFIMIKIEMFSYIKDVGSGVEGCGWDKASSLEKEQE